MMEGINIIQYDETRNLELLEFERNIVQGTSIKMEIVKDHALSRASSFETFKTFLALKDGQIVGTTTACITRIAINGVYQQIGFAFDTKVSPQWRNQGISKQLIQAVYDQFFDKYSIRQNFTTAKLSNIPVFRSITSILKKISVYNFVYLTIPSSARLINNEVYHVGNAETKMTIFSAAQKENDRQTNFTNGLAIYHTYRSYSLRITKIGFWIKWGLKLSRFLSPAKYQFVPKENDVIQTITLYNHTPSNIAGINDVLQYMEKQGMQYLMVCCTKNDSIYRTLSKLAINKYEYSIISDFPLQAHDNLCIDVRCL